MSWLYGSDGYLCQDSIFSDPRDSLGWTANKYLLCMISRYLVLKTDTALTSRSSQFLLKSRKTRQQWKHAEKLGNNFLIGKGRRLSSLCTLCFRLTLAASLLSPHQFLPRIVWTQHPLKPLSLDPLQRDTEVVSTLSGGGCKQSDLDKIQ